MVSKRVRWKVSIPPHLNEWATNRLVSAHIRTVNASLGGLILNIVICAAVLWGHVSANAILAGCGILGGLVAHRYYLANAISKRDQREHSHWMARAFLMNSIAMGLTTGLALALTIPAVSTGIALVLVVSGVTQIAGFAYTTRTLPQAALWHLGLILTGLLAGLAQVGGPIDLATGLLAITSTALQIIMVQVAYKSFVERILHERELHQSSETVRMLLNDYEAHGSDWLVELDANLCLTNVNRRFAEAAKMEATHLEGFPFRDLFAGNAARDNLESLLSEGQLIRRLTLATGDATPGEERWWSVSLHPAASNRNGTSRYRGVISDVSAEKQAEERVRHMAHYDSLTDLPNRLMFNAAVNRTLAASDSTHRHALLLIDFDHFKSINDMYGHPVGDSFLAIVGNRLAQTITKNKLGGEGHIVARLGGDEFAIFMGGEDVLTQSIRLAEHLVDVFAEPFEVEGHEVHAGVSIGIAQSPEHADSYQTLLSFADIALYVAKNEGRGRWEMFQPGLDEELHQRHSLARDLRSAVQNGELRLYLQPLVDVETSRNCGYEALMRWEHPQRGMVMPNDFIPIAEETGLIVPMGEWMIRTAVAEAARWQEPQTIAINLSPIQLRSASLIPTIMQALASTGIDPGRVEVEITESVLMHNSEANIEILNRLHALGLKIALDDFGTGYASLNYLLTFPFDKIKIDRSFVNDIEIREESRAIVGAVISLANKLGMCTLAEGVEHEMQLARLRQEGCSMVQGWLFGKAMPADHYARAERAEDRAADAA